MKILIILFTALINLSPTSLIASWPSFSIPTKEQLLNAFIIDTKQCASGFGKVHKGNTLPTGKNTMHFCPDTWQWNVMNNSECFNLKDFDYINHTVEYIYGEQGTVQQSVLTAFYGIQGLPYFSLIFTTPNDSWSCVEMNKTIHTFTCANDT